MTILALYSLVRDGYLDLPCLSCWLDLLGAFVLNPVMTAILAEINVSMSEDITELLFYAVS